LEIDSERGGKGELKGLILYLIHWVLTTGASSSRSHPHGYWWRWTPEDSKKARIGDPGSGTSHQL